MASAAYSSWREASENYLTGYCLWAGIRTADVWSSGRGQLYQTLLADPATAHLLDDSLFTAGVIGLPGNSNV